MRLAAATVLCASLGCSTSDSACAFDDYNSALTGCMDAQVFAARDTAGLIPSQFEVAKYFNHWHRALVAEPQMGAAAPRRSYRSSPPIRIKTRNPMVIAAWSQGELVSGESAFDSIIDQLRVVELNSFWSVEAGTYSFGVLPGITFNEEQLEVSLNQFDSTLGPRADFAGSDSHWTWVGSNAADAGSDGESAQIDATIGWGDCLSGCIFFHRLRAVVPPEGRATVFDLGGDPLPPGLELAPSTRPP